MTTIKTGGFINDSDIENGNYKPGKDDLNKVVILVKQNKIEELPKEYQEKVNKKLLTETVGGRKGTTLEEVKQRLVDKYYDQWQQEQKKAQKSTEHHGLSIPPDIAAMQADVEFIKQQLQKEKRANKKNTRKNRPNISIPLSFYGQPMRPVKNDIAKTSKQAINNQKDKKKQR